MPLNKETKPNTQPFQIKWEVYFSKNCVARLYDCVVMILHASAYEYTTVVSEFELQPRYYVHFRANTLGKGMNPLMLPAMS